MDIFGNKIFRIICFDITIYFITEKEKKIISMKYKIVKCVWEENLHLYYLFILHWKQPKNIFRNIYIYILFLRFQVLFTRNVLFISYEIRNYPRLQHYTNLFWYLKQDLNIFKRFCLCYSVKVENWQHVVALTILKRIGTHVEKFDKVIETKYLSNNIFVY